MDGRFPASAFTVRLCHWHDEAGLLRWRRADSGAGRSTTEEFPQQSPNRIRADSRHAALPAWARRRNLPGGRSAAGSPGERPLQAPGAALPQGAGPRSGPDGPDRS